MTEMTDRELLEMAAKAAGNGAKFRSADAFGLYDMIVGNSQSWNPLDDDGDALRLAVKLAFINPGCWPNPGYEMEKLIAAGRPDWNVATRRAIVRAAAEIARRQ